VASPIGHSLVGFAIGLAIQPSHSRMSWAWRVFVAFAANAPELDFLPGCVVRNLKGFHQGGSHLFVAGGLCGLMCGLAAWVLRRPILPIGTTGGLLYLSHLVLDLLTRDRRPPMGLPLLWPISQEGFEFRLTIFRGVSQCNGATSLQGFLEDLFAWSNAYALGPEIAILLPLAGGVVWWRRQLRDTQQ
jgi:hypothetical protein